MKRIIAVALASFMAALVILGCQNPTEDPPKSSNADLSGLSVSAGSLSPAFASGTTSYTVSVSNDVTSVTVRGSQADSNASVSGPVTLSDLAVGVAKDATIKVTAQDGSTTKSYTVTVTRLGATNADLSGITLSAGSLNPAFDAATTAYSVSVPNDVATITVTGTKADENAKVSDPVTLKDLAVGVAQVATIQVTAQDGTTVKNYAITVTRSSSANANLSALTLSTGTLSPAFDAGITAYSASVLAATSSVTVTGTPADPSAKVSANSGVAQSLNVGANTITITVTAQDGSAKNYVVTVTRVGSTNASLSALAVSEGTLSPAFGAGTTDYILSVPNGVTTVTVTGTPSDANAKASAPVTLRNLAVGVAQTATITVTAQDGTTTMSYAVKAIRVESSNANLSALAVSEGTLSPAFASGTTAYTVSVPNATSGVTVTGTKADSTATVSGPVTLSGLVPGVPQTATITVTAQDGTTIKSYGVTVTRAGSSNANLSGITLSSSLLSPGFSAATTSYSVGVSKSTASITVSGTKADSGATVSDPVTLNLAEGVAQTATITVTAQDGTKKEYSVKVTRLNFEMSLVNVPAGSFQRDASAGNISVLTKAYKMGTYEVTREQFKTIMGTDPTDTTMVGTSGVYPVNNVTWFSAIAFCNKLSLADGLTPVYSVNGITDWASLSYSAIPTGWNSLWISATADLNANGYRLPTDMEWMWAAMGAPSNGQGGNVNTSGYLKGYPGSSEGAGLTTKIGDYAWYSGNSGSKTQPVGKKLANELGIYDMGGNVFEWTWGRSGTLPSGTLTDYVQPTGDGPSIRGGAVASFMMSYYSLTYRGWNMPDYAWNQLGLRVVRN